MIIGGRCPVKKLYLPILVLAICTLMGCCVTSKVRHPESRPTAVDELKADTVALVIRDDDGDVAPYCAGVWVDKDKILTADHCAKAPVEAMVVALAGEIDTDDDEVVALLKKQVEQLEDGFDVTYIISDESTGIYREPKAIHKAKVLMHDTEHDLALIVVTDPPKHPITPIAGQTPAVGENVQVMGHPSGLSWTYTRGVVAAYREENFRPVASRHKKGPYLQVAGEVWKGNSGGGAYNDSGELIGIASFIAPAPNECFFVHLDTIKAFLARRR